MKKIIGLGNALVDILTTLDSDSTLKELGFKRGSMNLVDRNIHSRISTLTKDYPTRLSSGGSAANTIRGLSKLGVETGYIGKVGVDKAGQFLEKEFVAHNIKPMLQKSETPTGQCMVMISPDRERTMATFLGAAIELTHNEIDENLYAGYDILHIEGYLVQNHSLIREAIIKAKRAGLQVSLDMASFNIVEENLDFLTELIRNYVDIVFANEQEATSFTGLEPESALDVIASLCDIAVVKIGSKGSLIKSGGICNHINAVSTVPVDTTGAGDLYATGFLYGLSRGLCLSICGELGSLTASKVIEEVGPSISDEKWAEIRSNIAILIPSR